MNDGERPRKELAWTPVPNPGIIDGLICSRLINKSSSTFKKSDEHNPKIAERRPLTASNNRINRENTSYVHKSSTSPSIHSKLASKTIQHQRPIIPKLEQSLPKSSYFDSHSRHRQPAIEVGIPSIAELVSTQRKYSSEREITKLVNEYRYLINDDDLNEGISEEKRSEAFRNNLNSCFFVWNKANVQIRAFSEGHATLLAELKKYLQIRISKFPEIIDEYVRQIKDARSHNDELLSEIDNLNNQLADRDDHQRTTEEETYQLIQTIEELQNQITNLTSSKDELEIATESIKNENQINTLRLQKCQSDNESLRSKIKSLEDEHEIQKKQIFSLESTIDEYEKAGATFKPKYVKALNEIKHLKEEIDNLKKINNDLMMQPEYQDFETMTHNYDQEHKKVRKYEQPRVRRKLEKKGSTPNLSVAFRSESADILSEIEKLRFSCMDMRKIMVDSATQTTQLNVQPMSSRSANRRVSYGINMRNNLTLREIFDDGMQYSSPKKHRNQSGNFSNTNMGTATSDELGSDRALPEDYNIDHNKQIDSDTLINYIFRLLPLPIFDTIDESPFAIYNNISEGKGEKQNRSYFWVLKHIISFYQSMVGIDNTDEVTKDCITVAKEQFSSEVGIQTVANRLFNEMLCATKYYSGTSETVKFYLRFIVAELNMVDLKFFKMLFSISFGFIYPPINDLISNPDIKEFDVQFLIHSYVAKRIFTEFFPHIPDHAFNIDGLKSETKSTPSTELISFWVFSMKMIEVFRGTHVRFHKQVSSILKLVGWPGFTAMTEKQFRSFFTIINPFMDANDMDRLWERFELDKDYRNNDYVTHNTFIRFCSDFPDISGQILKLTYCEAFDQRFNSLSDPLTKLMCFIERRFTQFATVLPRNMSKEILKSVSKTLLSIRNSLLRLDLASAVAGYRRFLQIVDLKLMEEKPFMYISPKSNLEEVDELKSFLCLREKLICSVMNDDISLNEDIDTVEDKDKEDKPHEGESPIETSQIPSHQPETDPQAISSVSQALPSDIESNIVSPE